MSGHVGDLSPKQETALQQFKLNIKDILKPEWDDYFLLRWLRARGFDVKKTEKMIRDSMEWRRQNQVDQVLDWQVPEVLRLYYPGGYCGEDRQGHPIWIDTLGTVDMKGMFYSTTKKDILKWKVYGIELLIQRMLPEQCKKHGRRVDRSTLIFDMEHIGLKHLWKPAVDVSTEILAMLEANYPEMLETCYIINAPKILPVVWNIAKPFLNVETRKKIKLMGKNYKKQLLEYIDPDQLPVHWGGNLRDPDGDESCRSKVCMGGKIPEKYNMKNIRENLDMTNFENCTVQRGSTVQLDYDVTQPGSSLRWQFLSEGNDLGFGVYRRTADERQKKGEMEEVVKSTRVESHKMPEEGCIIVERPGKYVVRFDNTYSWVNAKKVSYLIEVLEPDTDSELHVTEF